MRTKHLIMGTLLLMLCSFHLYAIETKRHILLINSYHRGFQWSDDVISGIEKALYTHENIDINILYMDSKRISSDEYYRTLRNLYQVQLKNHNYDLILTVDKFAYEFVIQHYHELFTNQPVFFTGLEQFDKDFVTKYHLQNKVSGILEKRAINDIVKMISKIMPQLKKLYIVNDKSANGDDSEPFIEEVMHANAQKFHIEYIRSSSLKELSEKFRTYNRNEAVFFIRFYNDRDGHLYKNNEIATMINNSKLPVFVTDTLFLGKGAVGGKLVPIKELGFKTGKRVLQLLNGNLQTPFIGTAQQFEYLFDYNKVKEFHLNLNHLKIPFDYINIPLSFFDRYRQFINFVFVLSPLFLILILGLMHNIYLRIKSAKALRQRMEFDQVLLDAIESPIVWQDENGKIVDSNAKFCDLMGLPCPETRGKTLGDHIKENNAKSLMNALKDFIKNPQAHNEVTLKDHEQKEKIYLINQTKYTEDIYQSQGTVTIFTDVTKERKALQEKIKHQEFIIQQSKLAEIGEIFSSIAHQWKSPLVEITTIAQEQLYADDGEVDEKNNVFVNDIMVQVKYMTDTINDFQEFIMPSSKKVIFDIKDAIVRMIHIVEHTMKYNYINVCIDVMPQSNLLISGYKNELIQTMLNIVNNAKDAIIKAEKIKKGEILIHIFNHNAKVYVEIEDNAGGISKENLPKIFTPYFTTKKSGHGIGLYMAKLIIEDKMNGKISVENAQKGAKFCIELELYHENIST